MLCSLDMEACLNKGIGISCFLADMENFLNHNVYILPYGKQSGS